jgi:uncharacterized protein (DUF302 family)
MTTSTAPDDPIDETSDESFPASDAPAFTSMHAGPPNGARGAADEGAVPHLRQVRCTGSVDAVVTRIEGALGAAGMKVFARIDQAAEARAVGLEMRPTVILFFGSPKGGTPLMVARPTVAIELPLKALVWQDDLGGTWLAYNTPALLVERHGLQEALAAKLAPAGDLLEKAAR